VGEGKTVTVTEKTFQEIVVAGSSAKPVLVDFWAEWCGPCRLIAPVLEELAAEYSGVVIAKVNVDVCPRVAAEYSVMSIPTLILFVNGTEQKRIVGLRPKASLEADLADYLQGGRDE